MLDSVLGKCFRGPRCKFSRGHMKKGELTDAFVDGVTNVISKGVIYYTNLPVGEGGGGSPRNKHKGGGRRRLCGYLTPVGTGCSWMRNGGRAQWKRISISC
jgi:hypothetical protein